MDHSIRLLPSVVLPSRFGVGLACSPSPAADGQDYQLPPEARTARQPEEETQNYSENFGMPSLPSFSTTRVLLSTVLIRKSRSRSLPSFPGARSFSSGHTPYVIDLVNMRLFATPWQVSHFPTLQPHVTRPVKNCRHLCSSQLY